MNSLPVEVSAIIDHVNALLHQKIANSKTRISLEKIQGYGHSYYFGVKIYKVFGRSYIYCGIYSVTPSGIVAFKYPFSYTIDYIDPDFMQKAEEALDAILSRS